MEEDAQVPDKALLLVRTMLKEEVTGAVPRRDLSEGSSERKIGFALIRL